jgi:hypothetical protein
MIDLVLAILIRFNQLLTSAIAITAFSLLLYALTFNLRDRVARSFALILACMTMVALGDTLASMSSDAQSLPFWLYLQWVGIIFLPSIYFYSSDALLATVGKPSRGRRRLVVRLSIVASFVFLGLLSSGLLLGDVVRSLSGAPYLDRTWTTWIFMGFYGGMMVWSWVNYWRAYRRMMTRAGKRRLIYLMAGATAPAVGSFPFLLFGASVAVHHHLLFWLTVVLSNLFILTLFVLMAYAAAFFGVDWPDRLVKSRLFRWIMRGPVTASLLLALIALTRFVTRSWGYPTTASIEIVVMVGTILIMQFLITLVAPWVERRFFYWGDDASIETLQNLEARALTNSDLAQFLEAVLAAACDSLQSQCGFIAALPSAHPEFIVTVGDPEGIDEMPEDVNVRLASSPLQDGIFPWREYWLIPLKTMNEMEGSYAAGAEDDAAVLLGVMGVVRNQTLAVPADGREVPVDQYNHEAIVILAQRAAQALENQAAQQQLFSALEELTPQVEMIQQLRAASRYDQSSMLMASLPSEKRISANAIKDALDHFWGGPRFTQNPLLDTILVRDAIVRGETPHNALRSILRQAVEQLRPAGERRFTSEWILYNILDMKFLEGHRVKDVATRLAMSEADFYRKQRTAIRAVANILGEMERQAIQNHKAVIKEPST